MKTHEEQIEELEKFFELYDKIKNKTESIKVAFNLKRLRTLELKEEIEKGFIKTADIMDYIDNASSYINRLNRIIGVDE